MATEMGSAHGGLIMALNKPGLKAAILAICNNAKTTSMTEEDFADQLANAIDTFVKTGTVTTPAGVAVQVSPASGTGATTAPGIGTIS
jgi:hypothetical protein